MITFDAEHGTVHYPADRRFRIWISRIEATSCALRGSFLPITPVSGRVKPAVFTAAESSVCSARFRRVFGRGLERPAGGADTDAQFPGDDLP